MGSRMAANLRTHGTSLKVADLTPEKTPEDLKDLLVPKQHLFDWSDVLLLMLPDGNAVAGVIEEISAASSKEFIVLDCSTISPRHGLEFHRKLDKKGSFYFDAPVSGGVMAAENAELTFMLGGTQIEADYFSPLLVKMGKRVIPCGSRSLGQAAKLCNNMLLGLTMVGVSEAFAVANKIGLDLHTLASVLNSSSGCSWVTERYIPVPGLQTSTPPNAGYAGGFASCLMHKDLDLFTALASESGLANSLAALALKKYSTMLETESPSKDFSAIYQHILSQMSSGQ